MTKLTYLWTSNDNKQVKEFATWAEVKAQVAKKGGSYAPKYTPIKPDYLSSGYVVSEKRRKAMGLA